MEGYEKWSTSANSPNGCPVRRVACWGSSEDFSEGGRVTTARERVPQNEKPLPADTGKGLEKQTQQPHVIQFPTAYQALNGRDSYGKVIPTAALLLPLLGNPAVVGCTLCWARDGDSYKFCPGRKSYKDSRNTYAFEFEDYDEIAARLERHGNFARIGTTFLRDLVIEHLGGLR